MATRILNIILVLSRIIGSDLVKYQNYSLKLHVNRLEVSWNLPKTVRFTS